MRRVLSLNRLRRHYRLFDPRFYRRHNGLGRIYRGPLAYAHFRLLGERRGLDPTPLFSMAFVQRQRAMAQQPPLDRPFTEYIDEPTLWPALDPHPAFFARGEPFSPRQPDRCPLDGLGGSGLPWTDGDHPLASGPPRRVPEGSAVGLWRDGSLGSGLQALAEAQAHAGGERRISCGPFDVVLVAGDHHCPACAQYRVHNTSHALRLAGLRVASVYGDDLDRISAFDLSTRLLVVSRPTWSPGLAEFLADQREKGARIAFECDDILFDFPHVLGIQFDEAGRLATWNVNRHAESCAAVLAECDLAVFPTSMLGRVARARNPRLSQVIVAPSFLSDEQLECAEGIARPPRDPSAVVIAYSSGTWTHSGDFASVADAIAEVLRQRPQAVLRINGSLDVAAYPQLMPFDVAGRVVVDGRIIRDWHGHITRLADADINIVPLDIDNGFCHAKSEVRYIESGAVGVPTVASPVEAYARAIEHGVNGMLAVGSGEWVAALCALIDDATLRESLGRAARADVHDRYSPRGSHAHRLVQAVRAVILGGPPPVTVPQATGVGESSARRLDGVLLPGTGGAGEWIAASGMRCPASTVGEAGNRNPDGVVVLTSCADLASPGVRALSGERLVALGPQLHEDASRQAREALMGLHALDPGVFFPRMGTAAGAILVDVPERSSLETFGATVDAALEALATAVRDRFADREVVLICPGRTKYLRPGVFGIAGFESDVEFATLMRQSPALVVLDGEASTPAVSAAMLTGSPVLVVRGVGSDLRLEPLAWAVDEALRGELRSLSAATPPAPVSA